MAGTARTQNPAVGGPAYDEVRQEHNKLVDDVEVVRQALEDAVDQVNALIVDVAAIRTKYNAALAKLDSDAGVTDTNYVATDAAPAATATALTKTLYDTAGDLVAAKVTL